MLGIVINLRVYSVAAAGLAIVSLGVSWLLRSRRKTPEDRERERRARLTTSGRFTDGTVTDVQEISANGHGAVQVVLYSYDVSGVSYEASQDVTHLRQFIDVHSCRLGLPASIKYDPQNPGNSIVISEKWSGIRT